MSHGGHPNCRALIDKLYVRNLNACLLNLRRGEVVVDLGSKYKMVSKIMKQAAYLDPQDVYHFNPNDPTHFLENGMSFHLDKDSIGLEVTQILNQILNSLPQYTLLFCVRPNLGDYDARYF